MNTKLIPFDLDKAKNGAKVVTRNGYPVRIGFFELKGEHSFPVVGAVCIDGQEKVNLFTPEGKDSENESDLDLFIEEEEKEKPRREYSGTDSIYVPKDDEGIREELIDAINGLWDNDALPMPLSLKRKTAWITWLEKQGEENSTDNKPKFQKGDWVVFYPGCTAHQIIRVVENVASHTYGYDTVDDYYFSDISEGVRLWNINDAKDGDVLFHSDTASNGIFIFKEIAQDGEVVCYCDYDSEDGFCFEEYHTCCRVDDKILYPATKEQCDLLFQRMKETGYMWDSDKKELHKIGKTKTRRMTNQELSWWLRDCPEELREYTYSCNNKQLGTCYCSLSYDISEADTECDDRIVIRRNGGEWMEPLIEE